MLRKGQKLNATILHNLQVVEVITNTKALTDDLHQDRFLLVSAKESVIGIVAKNVQARPCYFSSWLC